MNRVFEDRVVDIGNDIIDRVIGLRKRVYDRDWETIELRNYLTSWKHNGSIPEDIDVEDLKSYIEQATYELYSEWHSMGDSIDQQLGWA